MSDRADKKYAALVARGFSGTIDDMEREYLLGLLGGAGNARSLHVNGLWEQVFETLGSVARTAWADMAYAYLGGLGYVAGTLPGRWDAYWAAGGHPQGNAPVLTNPGPQSVDDGQPFSVQVTQASGATPVTWSLQGGDIPAGMVVSAAGLVTWDPAVFRATAYSIVVRATHATEGFGQTTFALTVNP